jgi:uncharacterized RDD family membrane protein YckC
MDPNYNPTQQQQPGMWNNPMGSPMQPYPGGGLSSNQMNYALWGDRVLAALIDGGLILAAEIVLFIIIAVIGGMIGLVGGAAKSGGIVAFGWGFCCVGFFSIPVAMLIAGLYNKVFLISKRGYSVGQGVMKLKVVDANGNLIDTGKSVLRLLIQMGFSLVPFLPLISILFPLFDEPTRQTLHDKAVGTYVIKVGS